MTSTRIRFARLAALALGLAASPVMAQNSVGGSVDYLGYSLDAGFGVDAAQLLMIPLAVRVPATNELTFDLYSAWAQGSVESQGTEFNLSGIVDTSLRASYQATPWALVTLGVNIPTGDPSHDNEGALVASILSMDLLGFREATWGRGSALTSSVAVARRAGDFGLGLAAAYSMRGEFEPIADNDLKYQPGNESRVRLGVDRNFGNSTFTAGATFINYSEDQSAGQNLFQAGSRLRLDATYAFRAGAGVWTVYGADLIRRNGSLFIPGDTLSTSKQNLFVAGVMGAVGLGGGFVFRPHIDYKLQTRTEADGSDRGSGWMVAVGGDIPLRIFNGHEFFPKARVLFGSLKDASGVGISLLGMEFKGTIRRSF